MNSINYLGWESTFSIKPPSVFKILSKKFQWTQTIERDSVERSAYAMILGKNTVSSQLFVCGRVKLRSLGRRLYYY